MTEVEIGSAPPGTNPYALKLFQALGWRFVARR